MDDFLVRAILVGLLVAAIAGPLGCFVVWRRMAYFGDTLAHSALLGVALGLLTDIYLPAAIIFASVVLALLLWLMEGRSRIATDTLLGILAHSSLALGLVVLSFSPGRASLESYLFGDLLSVGTGDLIMIGLIAVIIAIVLYLSWKPLLSITLQEELARVEGLNVQRYRLTLMVLVALLVSISMKVVGVLLITALLIIPPAAARSFTRSPVTMALAASILGCTAVMAGLGSSWLVDTQVGPSVVLAASVLFVISLLFRSKQP